MDSVHPLHSVHAMHSVGALSSEHPTHRYGGGTCPVGKLVGAPIERGLASAYLAQRLLAHDRPAGIQICSSSSTLRGQHGGRMPRLLVESSLEHAHLMREAIERSSEAIKRSSESSLEPAPDERGNREVIREPAGARAPSRELHDEGGNQHAITQGGAPSRELPARSARAPSQAPPGGPTPRRRAAR